MQRQTPEIAVTELLDLSNHISQRHQITYQLVTVRLITKVMQRMV